MGIFRRLRIDDEDTGGLKTADLESANHGSCQREHHMRCAPSMKNAVYWIECDCGESGPEAPHERGAIQGWNEKFEKQQPISRAFVRKAEIKNS